MEREQRAMGERRKRRGSEMNPPRLEDAGCGWGVPLPTFLIKTEGLKVGLQLGLVLTA